MLTHGNSQNDPLFFLNTTCLKSKTILENLHSDPHINCINLHTHLYSLFTTSNYGISLGVYKLMNGQRKLISHTYTDTYPYTHICTHIYPYTQTHTHSSILSSHREELNYVLFRKMNCTGDHHAK